MSTKIKSAVSDQTLTVSPYDGAAYLANLVLTTYYGETRGIVVDPADLLAAIEEEGIGVVIPGTLPEVTVEGDRIFLDGAAFDQVAHVRAHDPIRLATNVRRDLALLRWLDAHPEPEVDEADVAALARELVGPDLNPLEIARMMPAARRAVASGLVTVKR